MLNTITLLCSCVGALLAMAALIAGGFHLGPIDLPFWLAAVGTGLMYLGLALFAALLWLARRARR